MTQQAVASRMGVSRAVLGAYFGAKGDFFLTLFILDIPGI